MGVVLAQGNIERDEFYLTHCNSTLLYTIRTDFVLLFVRTEFIMLIQMLI